MCCSRKKIYNSLMQKWLDDTDIWMYLTHNEEISVVAKRLRISLKVKIYQKMTANNSRSYLGYLNKLVDEYNNTCHYYIGKKSINANYSALAEEIKSSHEAPKFKVGDKVRIAIFKNILQRLHQKLVKINISDWICVENFDV